MIHDTHPSIILNSPSGLTLPFNQHIPQVLVSPPSDQLTLSSPPCVYMHIQTFLQQLASIQVYNSDSSTALALCLQTSFTSHTRTLESRLDFTANSWRNSGGVRVHATPSSARSTKRHTRSPAPREHKPQWLSPGQCSPAKPIFPH